MRGNAPIELTNNQTLNTPHGGAPLCGALINLVASNPHEKAQWKLIECCERIRLIICCYGKKKKTRFTCRRSEPSDSCGASFAGDCKRPLRVSCLGSSERRNPGRLRPILRVRQSPQ